MCKLLLSINPEYIDKIFSGIKKYELRKSQCRRPIDGIVLYCTSPVMKVVGEASVIGVLVDKPDIMWEKVKDEAGVTKKYYDSYFSGRDKAVAYQLGRIEQYCEPVTLEELGIKHAPQSFAYVY